MDKERLQEIEDAVTNWFDIDDTLTNPCYYIPLPTRIAIEELITAVKELQVELAEEKKECEQYAWEYAPSEKDSIDLCKQPDEAQTKLENIEPIASGEMTKFVDALNRDKVIERLQKINEMKFTEAPLTPELEKWAKNEIKEKSDRIKELAQEHAILYTEIEALQRFLDICNPSLKEIKCQKK